MEEERRTISEISKALGVPISTLRSWERRYGIGVANRTSGGHRRYGSLEVDLLTQMRDEVIRGRSARAAARTVMERRLREDPVSGVLVAATSELDQRRVQEVLNDAAKESGVINALEKVVFPALVRVGNLWAAGEASVAQEHMLAEEVRIWLANKRRRGGGRGPILLAAAPDDLHTLGMEAFAAVLELDGWHTQVLGAMTPVEAVVAAAKAMKPAAVVVSAQRSRSRRSAMRALDALHGAGFNVYYGGAAFSVPASRRGVVGVHLGEDLQGAAKALSEALT